MFMAGIATRFLLIVAAIAGFHRRQHIIFSGLAEGGLRMAGFAFRTYLFDMIFMRKNQIGFPVNRRSKQQAAEETQQGYFL